MQTEFIWNDAGQLIEVLMVDECEPALSTFTDVVNMAAREEMQLAGQSQPKCHKYARGTR